VVTAIVLINTERGRVVDVAQQLTEIDGVTEVFSVAGRYDLVATVRAPRNEDLADLVSGKLHKVPGIVDSETLIAFRVYRKSDVDAGFSLGGQG
jgi:DNA-binding Lrp family transcriptional regulator